jgi:DNA helicase II / ATP-dependent DNA helicase PcrA
VSHETCTRTLHKDLNEWQHKAVHLRDGKHLLAACAGSGKTKTIIHRIEQLIYDGVDPTRIGAFTFGKDAASEMQKRAKVLNFPETLSISTLHSLCYTILKDAGNTAIVDDKNQIYYLTKDLIGRNFRGLTLDPKVATTLIALAKSDCISMHPWTKAVDVGAVTKLFKSKADKQWLTPQYVKLFEQLEAAKIPRNLIDYEDMLHLAWFALTSNEELRERWASRFDYFLIDEAQDSSTVQNRVADILSERSLNCMRCGDCLQSLYSWRGAKPLEFTDFSTSHELHRLPVNYRSTIQICEKATNLTKDLKWNITGETIPHSGATDDLSSILAVEYVDPVDEATSIATDIKDLIDTGTQPRSIAVLYRVATLLQPVEQALLEHNIPYVVWSGHTFYDRKEIKDIMAYLYVCCMRDPQEMHVKRALNAPFRYISKQFIQAVEDVAASNKTAFIDALKEYKGPRENINTNVKYFLKLIFELNKQYSQNRAPKDMITHLLSDTKYLQKLKLEEGEDTADPDGGKATHVHNLINIASNFKTLTAFLDYTTKMEQLLKESRHRRNANAVVLSTVHKFKGQERDYIFSVGWNEGILPHWRGDIDEELRIAYVAITRAAKRFQCSWTRAVINVNGSTQGMPSRFIQKAKMPIRRLPIGIQKIEHPKFITEVL